LEKEICRRDRINDNLERGGVTLISVKIGVNTLLDKLSDIKLPPPHFNYCKSKLCLQLFNISLKLELHRKLYVCCPGADVFEQMTLAHNKLNQLMKNIGSQEETMALINEGNVTSIEVIVLYNIGCILEFSKYYIYRIYVCQCVVLIIHSLYLYMNATTHK
jgi:DNA-binding Xre family transcriptional regulator